jgi:hypothetical protein
MAVLIKHVHDPLPLPRAIHPDLSEALERVILKALAKEPQGRFQTAGDLAKALMTVVSEEAGPSERAAAGATIPSLEPTPPTAVSVKSKLPWYRRMPRRGWLAGGLIVIFLTLGSLVGGGALLSSLKGGQATSTASAATLPTVIAFTGATAGAYPTMAPGAFTTTAEVLTSPTRAAISTATRTISTETPAPADRTWQEWTQVQSFPAPGDEPAGIVRIGDDLWINVPCSNRIYRLDLEGNLLGELEMPRPGCGPRDIGLAWDGVSLWGTWWDKAVQIDPNSGQALSEFEIDSQSRSIAWDGYLLWVVDLTGNLSVYERDGQRLRRLGLPVYGVVSAITWVEGELWLLNGFGDITRFNGDLLELGEFSLEVACGISSFHEHKTFGLFWDGESLWVADAIQNRIFQCKPAEGP